MKRFVWVLSIICLLTACSEKKRQPVFFGTDDDIEDYYAHSGDEISIPFHEEGGVKYLSVKVNGIARWDMIFDTGCSGTLISLAEANYLYQKGALTDDDFLGKAHSMIADGSVVENAVIKLEEIVIDDKIQCLNVVATVSNNVNAPLLLGNEVWNRLATIKIDNEEKTINLKLK